jgi:hypothetical protein
MKYSVILFSIILLLFSHCLCIDEEDKTVCKETINALALNEYQILGSHNSYRLATDPDIMDYINQSTAMLPEDFDPLSWDYSHAPVLEQLNNYGIRSLELDLYRDPNGALFYNRKGNALVGRNIESGISALKDPGLKILHYADFDFNTEYYSFKSIMNELIKWSDSNPTHLPLYILLEAKEDNPASVLPNMNLTSVFDFRNGAVEEIEDELIELFGSRTNKLIRPDDIIIANKTLKESIENKAWPPLKTSRGKFVFILLAEDEVIESYVAVNSLKGRMMFVFTDPNKDEAAFLNITDPIRQYKNIQDYVGKGYIVRTQADSDTYEERSGDYTRMIHAFESGAQIICTDYYRADPRSQSSVDWSSYVVNFPNNKLAITKNIENGACTIME